MRSRAVGLAAFSLLVLPVLQAEDSDKVALRLKEDQTLHYQVERSSSFKGEGQQGAFESSSESKAAYRIEVADVADDAVTLRIRYDSLQAKDSGRGEPWSFDSTKKEEASDENSKLVRELVGATYTATVKKGQIGEVTGGPDLEGGDDGDQGARFRRFRALRVAGPRSIRQDLEQILAAPVQGKALEKGKTYTAEAEPDGEGGRRGRFFRFGTDFTWKLEEVAEKDGGKLARFKLAAEPARDDRPGPQFETKVDGKASIALATGILASLEAVTEMESKGDRGSFSSRSKIKVTQGKKVGDDDEDDEDDDDDEDKGDDNDDDDDDDKGSDDDKSVDL